MTERKHAGGRPRKGSLEFRGKTWHARLTVTVEGLSVRKWVDLKTDNKIVARRKLTRLNNANAKNTTSPGQLAELAARAETVAEAGKRIFKERESEVRDIVNDPIRFKKHVAPHIGELAVTEVASHHIRDVLDQAKENGLSRRTLTHLRRVMNLIFGSLWQDEVLSENPVARVKVPNVHSDKRERAVLTDTELVRYLGWQHPEAHHGMAVLERQTMACISRCFGGLRTGDMHALRWESLDTADGRFLFGWAPRKKTARSQLLEIPEMLRPLIQDWWERAGKPATGELTHRERELFEDTPFTKPVDFHSWRRAYSQALAEAGASAQQAQALAGHASLDAHQRYLNNTSKMALVPPAALPSIRVLPQLVAKPVAKSTNRKPEAPVLAGGGANP